ncbi:MAG: serine O-acetyltransferase [Planctomycetaceae bacterium]
MSTDFGDPVWKSIRDSAEQANDPNLASFLHSTILNHQYLEDAVSFHIAGKLAGPNLPAMMLREVIEEAFKNDPNIGFAIRADICAVQERDAAVNCCLVPFLFLKGVHALISYRVAHWLWKQERRILALYLQNRMSETFGADIHPAAKLGKGILVDHATSVVIGETAVVEDNVSMLHEVTLGGTGKEVGDRHPKVREGVLIGAGAKVLGNVEVGKGSRIGAGSVVLNDVPEHCTVAGVPATIVGRCRVDQPALAMDHSLQIDQFDGSGI